MAYEALRLPARYQSPELIARGGMADVYRATDSLLGREVAIKVLSDRHADDGEFRARFTREAQTAARLSGEPGIVTIFDVGDAGGRPYIVMELLTAGSVADRLRQGRVTHAQALEWVEQAGRALDAAHAQGVVHRDVKPANLMLSRDGDVYVTDFGIARAAGLSSLTSTGTIMGSSGYMSPEQASGGRATEASDRYALAVVAFELLTGRRPYVADNPTAEAAAHLSAPVPRASSIDGRLPAGVDAVLARGMAKKPEDRYATCGELAWELRAAFRAAAEETAAVRTAVGASTARPRRGGIPLLAAALGALALLGAAGIGAAMLVGAGDGGDEALTVVRTQTVQGEERLRTVTIEVPKTVEVEKTVQVTAPPETTPPPTEGDGGDADEGPPDASGAELNDEGFRRMGAGDFAGALPLLERAVEILAGDGGLAEAYASYNLAFTRLALGRCDGVLELLDRSEQVQGYRKEIDRLRRDARKACGED